MTTHRIAAHWAALALLAGAATGCTAPMRPETARQVDRQHVLKSNYQLNVPVTVNVGEALVKVQDYWQDSFEEPTAYVDMPVTLSGGPITLSFAKGQPYRVRGRIAVEGKDYSVIAPDNNAVHYQAALVGDDGKPLNRVVATGPNMHGDHVMVVYTMDIKPPDARFDRKTDVRIDTSKGFVNYELLYTGISENAINMTYREFSPDGLARVAFFQNLTYPRTAATITFRQIRLNVDRVSPESISATVIFDGSGAR